MRRAWLAAAFVSVALAAAFIGVLLVGAKPAHADSLTVNSTGDGADFALDGNCDADPRATVVRCTLRAAIQEANNSIAHPGADTINFDIPTTDPNCNANTKVCTISPASALPKITGAVTIDGYSQPGASENTAAVGENAVLLIQLNGANAGGSVGLDLDASNSVVKGLVINRFGGGIALDGDNNTIEGNFIGTNPSGAQDRGNDFEGVGAFGSNNTLGAPRPRRATLSPVTAKTASKPPVLEMLCWAII
jgi:CSLREA domain-containing protein